MKATARRSGNNNCYTACTRNTQQLPFFLFVCTQRALIDVSKKNTPLAFVAPVPCHVRSKHGNALIDVRCNNRRAVFMLLSSVANKAQLEI